MDTVVNKPRAGVRKAGDCNSPKARWWWARGGRWEGRWGIGLPATVTGNDPTLNKPSLHRKASVNCLAVVFLVG